MKDIKTLISDIYSFVSSGVEHEQRKKSHEQERSGDYPHLFGEGFSERLAIRLRDSFTGRSDPAKERIQSVSDASGLRLSKMGTRCPHALWCEIHTPHLAETLPPWAQVKYAFGHILEVLVLELVKASEHEVTGEQDALELDGIPGTRDCVIDGAVVDVKSATSRGFIKFKTGAIEMEDSFGYLYQLDGYVVASREDPLVRIKDRGYLLAIDKQLGHICLHEHKTNEARIRERIREYKGISLLRSPPQCNCGTIPDGASGNIRLDVRASYNPYKYCCNPNLRTFLYADGPRYLTKVERLPRRQDGSLITEVDCHGKIVYN